jgi:GT2 family glycosyltransferase
VSYIRIAVLMTCHNRKTHTLECLKKLYAQDPMGNILLDIFLVDDGSKDGTTEAVAKIYPKVYRLAGNGNLYWCGGMRLAFSEALKSDYDYYWWLNDDTKIFADTLQKLINTENSVSDIRDAIIVGSVSDTSGRHFTYGGSLFRRNRMNIPQFTPVTPGDTPYPCDIFNGNCVLIPRSVAQSVGNIRYGFVQGGGDRDYGLRASQLGFSSWVCPGYIGICDKNTLLEGWRKEGISLKERIKIVSHPVRVHRIHDWMRFTRYHCKVIWPLFWIRAYLRLWFPALWILIRLKLRPNVANKQSYAAR